MQKWEIKMSDFLKGQVSAGSAMVLQPISEDNKESMHFVLKKGLSVMHVV